MNKKVVIGADHAGFKLKEHLKKFLTNKKYLVLDKGAKTYNPTDDYPDYAKKVTKEIKQNTQGILICGSAEGICIVANKKKGIRAVPVWTVTNAKLSRQHNDANILCLSGWQLNKKKAEKIVLTWLTTKFSNEPKHIRRIKKIEK
ncbi:ribose-5-phosphate isomerase [Candidatus Woesearchaeota archaeon CG10_big_fil_rev_8_21_14_0_10_30_7]|nr:MAG: ribose-5-phosphate isomerase [Candidatus Woesearchaeota archaeon CG10_big_fil_rev_8_21_14_0_10_30_7]